MTRNKREQKIRDRIRLNRNITQAFDRFVKQINTPEKADETFKYLMYGFDTKYITAFQFLKIIGDEMQICYMHKTDCVIRPLADLCLLLGSPDNCRIVSCAVTICLNPGLFFGNERDSSNSEWNWMWDARRTITKLIDGITEAKIIEEDREKAQAKEVSK